MTRHVLRGDHAWVTYAKTRTCSAAKDKPTLIAEAEVWWYQRASSVLRYDAASHRSDCSSGASLI
eukprot:420459-Pleurochrysis_carterae.AAC.1